MPCKVKIKGLLEDLVDVKTQPGLNMSISDANELAYEVNLTFKSNVVNFRKVNDQVLRAINVHDSLVNRYYDKQLKKELDNRAEKPSTTKVNTLELDLNDLNLTPDVVNYLYQTSRLKSKGIDLNTYNKEVSKLINNLRSDFTNKEILEKIKCL